MPVLADNRSIEITKADKGSTVVVWDHNDYILEAEKQLSDDTNVYKAVFFKKKNVEELVGRSNQLFQNLKSKGKLVINCLNTLHMSIKKFLI